MSGRKFQIVVLDRGFVYAGHVAIEGDWVDIEDAINLRYWGTTRGLGQLALEGPTDGTKIDRVGHVRAPIRALISLIDTREESWTQS
ncbi:unnamed protein product [uncultured bacterium]|nr:unnamed protein product [uncultured bacterium]